MKSLARQIREAIDNGNHKLVQELIKDASSDNWEEPETPIPILNYAVLLEDMDVIQLLLNSGANINQSDIEENTPLMHAVRVGNLEIVKFLINSGAEISVVSKSYRVQH
jgi:ankyrin repeat protein